MLSELNTGSLFISMKKLSSTLIRPRSKYLLRSPYGFMSIQEAPYIALSSYPLLKNGAQAVNAIIGSFAKRYAGVK